MRPRYVDRSKLKKRVNVALSDEAKEKARKIGDGNVSRGIDIALENTMAHSELTEEPETELESINPDNEEST